MDKIKRLFKLQVRTVWPYILILAIMAFYSIYNGVGGTWISKENIGFLIPWIIYIALHQNMWNYFEYLNSSMKMGVTRSSFIKSITFTSILNAVAVSIVQIGFLLNMGTDSYLFHSGFELFKIFISYTFIYFNLSLIVGVIVLFLYKFNYERKKEEYLKNLLSILGILNLAAFPNTYQNIGIKIMDMAYGNTNSILLIGAAISIILYLINSKLILNIDAR